MGTNNALVVQKKLMPCKNPKNNGGSPKGVNEPPILDTKNMKKIIRWVLFFLHEFARINGLINSIDAPVVPIIDANNVPVIRKHKFKKGEPFEFPEISIPPDTVNNENKSTIKGIYSDNIIWRRSSEIFEME